MQHEDTRLHSLLSKKIADLVKVVDKLFRSNHTAQLENVFLRKDLVEFEALRKENEALKEKVDALEGKVREADERLKHECEKLKELHRLEMDKLYEEMKSKEEAILDELRERDHALSDMEHELGRKTMQTKELQSNLSEYKKRYKAASSSGRDANGMPSGPETIPPDLACSDAIVSGRMTTGLSRPFAPWTVITLTRSSAPSSRRFTSMSPDCTRARKPVMVGTASCSNANA